MTNLINWLKKPYPYTGTLKDHFLSALWGGLFVFLFLIFFKPFGIKVPEAYFWDFVQVCSWFGGATALVLILAGLAMHFMPAFFREEDWNIGREIISNVLIVMLIGTANLIVAGSIFNQPFSWPGFLAWQRFTFLIGIFPILFTAYSKHQILQKRYSSGAAGLNTRLESHPKHQDLSEPVITLEGDNQQERITLPASGICYLAASDNYVRVVFTTDGNHKSELLRGTLRKMESQLSGYPAFFRCHRTYIVNLDLVHHVSGNAQGFKLHLQGIPDLIPVSRSLNDEITKRLS